MPTTTLGDGALDEIQAARANWARYLHGMMRGHDDYCEVARMLEDFYLGGGKQWSAEDREYVESQGRPALEFNQVMPKINIALAHQIHNRMDIQFKPRGGAADEELASTLSKLAMQIADQNMLHFKESAVFADGVIQQRGYYDVRISYDNSILGEIKVGVLDPMDVIPDPDAKSPDPDDWADVTILRWMTLADIEQQYGQAAANGVRNRKGFSDEDFGFDTYNVPRSRFGNDDSFGGYSSAELDQNDDSTRRYRIVDRQYWRMRECDIAISLTGDIYDVSGLTPEQRQGLTGVVLSKRRMRRVMWTVTTEDAVLYHDWSIYRHFTVVPFFPFFRRGQTRGLVDAAVGPQKLLNKTMSQMLHVINTTANSGWITTAGTINNMSPGELEDRGAETGLVIEVKANTKAEDRPQKITPNPVPTGLDRIVDRAHSLIDDTTGIHPSMQGSTDREISGVAIQSYQFAGQQSLAVPLDMLQFSRVLLANRFLELIQAFYDEPRIVRITEVDAVGQESDTPLHLNWDDGSGNITNDLTIGKYDVVITEVPVQVTFQNSQFQQVLEMTKAGIPGLAKYLIRYSNLADKQTIIKDLDAQQQPQQDPLTEAKVELTQAQAQKTRNEATSKAVEQQYSAIQAGATIAQMPAVAPVADTILKSAGFEDHDAAPLPEPTQAIPGDNPAAGALPHNTHPLTPAHAAVGLNAGIETPRIEGAPAQP